MPAAKTRRRESSFDTAGRKAEILYQKTGKPQRFLESMQNRSYKG